VALELVGRSSGVIPYNPPKKISGGRRGVGVVLVKAEGDEK
jgi:hypothetical protein